jgi:hypothetical protein
MSFERVLLIKIQEIALCIFHSGHRLFLPKTITSRVKYLVNLSYNIREESNTMNKKQNTHIAMLIGVIGIYGLLGPQAKGIGLGNLIKDGLIGAATGDVGGSIAIGVGVRAVTGDSKKKKKAEAEQVKRKQAEAERAETKRMQARQSEREAEQKAKAAYEVKLRNEKRRQDYIDFRKAEQRRQMREISRDRQRQPNVNQQRKAGDGVNRDKK